MGAGKSGAEHSARTAANRWVSYVCRAPMAIHASSDMTDAAPANFSSAGRNMALLLIAKQPRPTSRGVSLANHQVGCKNTPNNI